MKLHRDLGIGDDKAAWFVLHRIQETRCDNYARFVGPAEADAAYFGVPKRNKHADKKLNAGRGTLWKTLIAGVKLCASNRVAAHGLDGVDGETLTVIAKAHTEEGATVYTGGYGGRNEHETVKLSVDEHMRGTASARAGFMSKRCSCRELTS